jgi:hypothetical protein
MGPGSAPPNVANEADKKLRDVAYRPSSGRTTVHDVRRLEHDGDAPAARACVVKLVVLSGDPMDVETMPEGKASEAPTLVQAGVTARDEGDQPWMYSVPHQHFPPPSEEETAWLRVAREKSARNQSRKTDKREEGKGKVLQTLRRDDSKETVVGTGGLEHLVPW